MVIELFGQGGPRGRVEAVVGCCRSSTEWFLSPGSLGCHVTFLTQQGPRRPHRSDTSPNKRWRKHLSFQLLRRSV